MAKDHSAEGLRGMAAMGVVIAHSLLAFFPSAFTLYFPWVASQKAAHGQAEGFLSTPVVSVLWNGSFPVWVFFVLSGYVLTKSLVESGDAAVARSLAWRRYFRLAGPVLGSALLACSLMASGLYFSKQVSEITGSAWLAAMWNVTPNFWEAAKQGVYGALLFGEVSYNPVFWTLQIEFFGSLLILAYRCIATSRNRQFVAAPAYVILAISIAPNEWVAYVAFLIGTHLNDLRAPKTRVALVVIAALGLYLGGVSAATVYSWAIVIPLDTSTSNSLIAMIGAALLVYAVKEGAFSIVLASRPAKFLGRISYSLYLVHLPIILSLTCGLYLWFSANGIQTSTAASALTLLVSIPATLGVAVLFTQLIDEPCIRWSKRIFPVRSPIAGSGVQT